MTYQITLKGIDGMVMARDRLEVEDSGGEFPYPTKSHLTKISVSNDGRFAWSFYGDHMASCVAAKLNEELIPESTGSVWLRDASIRAEIKGMEDWATNGGSGTRLPHGFVLADRQTNGIYKSVLDKRGLSIRDDNYLFTGQDRNAAALIVERFYDPSMTVDELVILAAYSVHVAHYVSPNFVNGLDIAACRDGSGFRMLSRSESDSCLENAMNLETELRNCVKRIAFSVQTFFPRP